MKLAEIAFEGVKYLGQVATGKEKPRAARIAVILAAVDHTIGRAKQHVDQHLTGDLTIRLVKAPPEIEDKKPQMPLTDNNRPSG